MSLIAFTHLLVNVFKFGRCRATPASTDVAYEVVDSFSGSEPAAPARKQLKMKRNTQKKCKALS